METAPFLLLDIILWMVSVMLAIRIFRLCRGGDCATKAQGGLPSVSIVIVSQDQEADLRRVLPLFLGQLYDGEFNVIVSDLHSSDETLSYLEEMEELYPHLAHTSVPSSARDISLRRLAMTLGVRSAYTEWVIFTDASCSPRSEGWLSRFMGSCRADADAVLGMTIYQTQHGWTEMKRQFFRLWQQALWIPFAQSHAPYRADDSFLAYRRTHFLQHSGFGTDSSLIGGAATLLVNRHISGGRCSVSLGRETLLVQNQPPQRKWAEDRFFFMETRRHMRQGFLYRLWYLLHSVLPHVFGLYTLGLIVWHIPNYYVMAGLFLLWLIACLLRLFAFRNLCRCYGVVPYYLSFFVLESLIPLWDVSSWLRWRFTKKNTFRKKFV